MAEKKCANCGHQPGHLIVQHTTNYYECRKCGQKFCSHCKKTGPACPKCSSTSIKQLPSLGT